MDRRAHGPAALQGHRRGIGQQDRSHHLGSAGQRRNLSGTASHGQSVASEQAFRRSGAGKGSGFHRGQRSMTAQTGRTYDRTAPPAENHQKKSLPPGPFHIVRAPFGSLSPRKRGSYSTPINTPGAYAEQAPGQFVCDRRQQPVGPNSYWIQSRKTRMVDSVGNSSAKRRAALSAHRTSQSSMPIA